MKIQKKKFGGGGQEVRSGVGVGGWVARFGVGG